MHIWSTPSNLCVLSIESRPRRRLRLNVIMCTSNCMVRKINIHRGITTNWTWICGLLRVLQALVDGTKLLFKEDLFSSRGNTHLLSIRLSIIVISILLSYSVISFGYCLIWAYIHVKFFLVDCHINFLFNGLSSQVLSIKLFMSVYGFNNKIFLFK